MNAIPQCYPVTVECKDGKPDTITEGVTGELVNVRKSHILESGTEQVQLLVAARSEAMARERAERVTQGKVVEVGPPSPLQDYTKRKALPYRRSFIMSRYKRGRFCQQGGTGSHQAASLPNATPQPSAGVGMAMGESIKSLMGPDPLIEATAAQRAARERRRKQFRAKHPKLARKRAIAAKKAARKGTVQAKRRKARHMTRRRTARFRGKFDPRFEDTTMTESTATPTLESQLSGYSEASKLHQQLSKAPLEWRESTRGRKVIADAIYGVRLREGNAPADALEDAYLSMPEKLKDPLSE